MPKIQVNTKEVPDWEYSKKLKPIMKELEEAFEKFREDVAKSGRNLVACRRARTSLQHIRKDIAPRVRKTLFEERDRLEALRHGVSLDEWKRNRNSGS